MMAFKRSTVRSRSAPPNWSQGLGWRLAAALLFVKTDVHTKDGGVPPAAARIPFASVRWKLCQNELSYFEIATFGIVVLGYQWEGCHGR
jgi:hypothetical protein